MNTNDMNIKDFQQFIEDDDEQMLLSPSPIEDLTQLRGGKTFFCAMVPVSQFPESLRMDFIRVGGQPEDEIPVVISINFLDPQFIDMAAYHGVPKSAPMCQTDRYYAELSYSFGRVRANGDKLYEPIFREMFPQFNIIGRYRK